MEQKSENYAWLGFWIGIVLCASILLIDMTIDERECMELHNVYDCKLADPLFVPVIPGEKT